MQGRGWRWTLFLACLLAAAVIAVAVASLGTSPSIANPRGRYRPRPPVPAAPRPSGARAPLQRLFSSSSPLNTPIPPNAAVAPDSQRLIRGLADVAAQGGFALAVRRWTVPVYLATAATERYRVSITAPWAPHHHLGNIPIPADARPDPSSDAQMAVLDQQTHCEFDFWRAARHGQTWSSAWVNSLSTTGPGVFPHGLSARGSGFALLAGLIWPRELARGEIRHALIFSYPYTSAAGFVRPATETDGKSTRPDAIPEGARLQLDPALNVSRLPPYERTIARALQTYGMYLADTGGRDISLYAVSPRSYPRNPYSSTLPAGTYVDLGHIPVTRFRVIAHGPLVHNARSYVRNACSTLG